MRFKEKLKKAWLKNNSLICVGLDTELEKAPPHILEDVYPIFNFNKEIIDATADLVCAYKPQIAYYSAVGGEKELLMTIEYIHENYPDIPVILDAKRGDIGATAKMYAREAFERYLADAVTVNPYMGGDTLEPFLSYEDRGVIILCRTSNPGGADVQMLSDSGKAVYEIVAEKACGEWNKHDNVLLVVGATYPEELGVVRRLVGDMPLLVPGIGAQGGDVEKTVANGLDSEGMGMIINSSRGIIYAGGGRDFAEAARVSAQKLRDEVNSYR